MATEWLTLADAASRFGVSVRTVQRRISAGELDTVTENGRRLVAVVTPDNGATQRDTGGGHTDAAAERSMQLAAAVSASADRVRILAELRADELRADLTATRRWAWSGWAAVAVLGVVASAGAVVLTGKLASAETQRDALADTVSRADAAVLASEAREARLTAELAATADALSEAQAAALAASERAERSARREREAAGWFAPLAVPGDELADAGGH